MIMLVPLRPHKCSLSCFRPDLRRNIPSRLSNHTLFARLSAQCPALLHNGAATVQVLWLHWGGRFQYFHFIIPEIINSFILHSFILSFIHSIHSFRLISFFLSISISVFWGGGQFQLSSIYSFAHSLISSHLIHLIHSFTSFIHSFIHSFCFHSYIHLFSRSTMISLFAPFQYSPHTFIDFYTSSLCLARAGFLYLPVCVWIINRWSCKLQPSFCRLTFPLAEAICHCNENGSRA